MNRIKTINIGGTEAQVISSPALPLPENARLVAKRTLSGLTGNVPCVLAPMCNAGIYYIRADVSVSRGTLAANSLLPSLTVGFMRDCRDGNGMDTVIMTAPPLPENAKSSRSSSMEVVHDGQSVITAGVSGGRFHQQVIAEPLSGGAYLYSRSVPHRSSWEYDATVSIWLLQ